MESGESSKDMIETERLELRKAQVTHLEAFLESESKLAAMLGISIEEGWLVFPEAVAYGIEYLKQNPDNGIWWMYFFIHKADKRLIGNGGYKGKPDAEGMVEIGYAVAPGYEGRGLATEAARGMIDRAFEEPEVKMVDAHTLAEENASCGVLKKLGMKKIAEKHDPEDGDIWHWRVLREEYKR